PTDRTRHQRELVEVLVAAFLEDHLSRRETRRRRLLLHPLIAPCRVAHGLGRQLRKYLVGLSPRCTHPRRCRTTAPRQAFRLFQSEKARHTKWRCIAADEFDSKGRT